MGTPQRKLGPLPNLVVDKYLRGHPLRPSRTPGHLQAHIQKISERHTVGVRDVVRPPIGAFGPIERELRDITNIDGLDTPFRRSRYQNPTTPSRPVQPPRKTTHVLPRPQNHPGPQEDRGGSEHLGHGPLPTRLLEAVLGGAAINPVVAEPPIGVRRTLQERRLLKQRPMRPIRVHRHRRNMHPTPHRTAQRASRKQHIPGREVRTRGIDHRIPGTSIRQTGKILGNSSVPVNNPHPRHIPSGTATVERRHLPTAPKRALHHALPQKPRSPEHQEPHGPDDRDPIRTTAQPTLLDDLRPRASDWASRGRGYGAEGRATASYCGRVVGVAYPSARAKGLCPLLGRPPESLRAVATSGNPHPTAWPTGVLWGATPRHSPALRRQGALTDPDRMTFNPPLLTAAPNIPVLPQTAHHIHRIGR